MRKAQQVNLPKIQKIQAGSYHSLALTEQGEVYGWGSNSKVQLSHEVQFSRVDQPVMAYYNPIQITHNLENNKVYDIAAGDEFSVFSTINKCNFLS